MRNFLNWFAIAAALVGIMVLASSTGKSQHFGGRFAGFRPSVFHFNPQPHWGCYGYCGGPLRPHQPHWGCFGYCPGPLPYGHYYTCFGYCPYVPPYYPPFPPYPPLVYQAGDGSGSVLSSSDQNPPVAAEKPAPKSDEPLYSGKTLGDWIKALKDPSSRTRADAAATLTHIGPEAKAAIPALVEVLKDTDAQVRVQASLALGAIGKPAIPALIDATRQKNKYLQMGAALKWAPPWR
jgi:HEAT repeats